MTPHARHTLTGLIVLFVVILAGIGGWYWVHTSQSQAAEEQQLARKDAGKMIPVKIIVKAPAETPANQPLYVSGSAPVLGNWQVIEDGKLEKQDDGRWAGNFELMNGVSYGFKVTRGTWGTVERGPNDADVPNHEFTAEQNKPIEVEVAAWVDHGKAMPKRVTATGVVPLGSIKSKHLDLPHDVYVYLPPNYDVAEDQRYPVLYMQDGQNIFNEATAFASIEWQMDETAQRLINARQIAPVIIVGVANNDARNSEYTPPGMNTGDTKFTEPKGDAYGKFLVDELKPFIDQRFRTMPERQNTGIGGSAMGALASIYVAKTNPDVFGMVGVCSPWLRSRDGKTKLAPQVASDAKFLKQTRWYIDMGDKGSGAGYPPVTDPSKVSDPSVATSALADAREFIAALDSAGLAKGKDYVYEEVKGGEYREEAWQSRVEPMLKALFPPQSSSAGSARTD